jgi:predicted Fe-Mo cluster-binding NifX family protein
MTDTESGGVDMIRNAGQHHTHGDCKPISHIDAAGTDAVVCQGMGKRAFASLRKSGLEVWITSADTVRDAIAEVRAGRIEKLSVDTACGGHGAMHTKHM